MVSFRYRMKRDCSEKVNHRRTVPPITHSTHVRNVKNKKWLNLWCFCHFSIKMSFFALGAYKLKFSGYANVNCRDPIIIVFNFCIFHYQILSSQKE